MDSAKYTVKFLAKFSVVILVPYLLCSCATHRIKPCSEGGQPAREVGSLPIEGLIKRCYQKVDGSGFTLNHGKYFEWYPNDKVAIQGEYSMGKKTGRWLVYDPGGNKVSDKWFQEGKEVGAP